MGIEIVVAFIVGVMCGHLLRGSRKQGRVEVGAAAEALSDTEAPSEVQSPPAVAEPEAYAPDTETPPEVQVPPAVAEPEAHAPDTETPSAETEGELRSQMLQVIRSSEAGISLPTIGVRLGRHFASLIHPMRLLIEEGIVEKQGNIYKMKGVQ